MLSVGFQTALLWCAVVMAHACVWPEYFLIAENERDPYFFHPKPENSWQTQGRIRSLGTKLISRSQESMTWISPVGNNTIRISNATENEAFSDPKKAITLTCQRDFGNAKFLVKVVHGSRIQASSRAMYQCIQFVKRSPFVLQWRMGLEDSETMECPDDFVELSPWPLIWFPLRNIFGTKNSESYPEIQNHYQPCPKIGGFHLRVFDSLGVPMKGSCNEDDPVLRLEMECYHGDGMRIIQGQPDCPFSQGWKLHCLGSWEEDRYTFSVLVPNDKFSIRSFHCLRINTDDPTSERAVLFLDTICQSGNPSKYNVSFVQLELRRAHISGICDDFSDTCTAAECDKAPYSCPRTCRKCPVIETIEFDKSVRGRWLVPLQNLKKRVVIEEKKISIFGNELLKAYSLMNNESKCFERPMRWSDDGWEYVLAGPGNGQGCSPRVTQLRVRRISESVLLFHLPATAPLRGNSDIATPSQWCRNNYMDISMFGSVFRPDTPHMAISRTFKGTNGYFTMVSEESQEPAKTCIDFDKMEWSRKYELMHNSHHLKISLVVGGQTGRCKGESRMNGNEWKLQFTCPDGAREDTAFTCLGDYAVSGDYHAVVLKAPSGVADKAPLSFRDAFYCLMIPFGVAQGSPLLLNMAGRCDPAFLEFVYLGVRKPLAELTVDEVVESSGRQTRTSWGAKALLMTMITLCKFVVTY